MKRAFVICVILALTVLMANVGYFVVDDEPIAAAFLLGFLTLLTVGGTTYLVHYVRCMSKVRIPDDELDGAEVVWAKTPQSMVHYKSGNPFRFWEAVGGKLFLTNQVLEFRANPAEVFVYRVTMPLEQIRKAEPHRLFGIIPGALRIERDDGSVELFTFGAAFDISQEWAYAIMEFRDDLFEAREYCGKDEA